MYAYFIGEVTGIEEDYVILETNHIGYRIFMPASSIRQLNITGEEIKIYTYTCVREDAFILYGFLAKDELALFKLLITVSGIGPKGALSILSVMDIDTLRISILSQDAKILSKAPGIGIKTAGRIILELKDKINPQDILNSVDDSVNKGDESRILTIRNEASEALVSLGYNNSDTYRVIRQITITEDTSLEQVIKEALKKMI